MSEETMTMLWRMEEAFADDTSELLAGLFDTDVLLMGAWATAEGIAEARTYAESVLSVVDHVEWDYDHCWAFAELPDLAVVAATGELVMKEPGKRLAYRLSFSMRHGDDGWKVTLFHGSCPPD